MYPCFKCTVKPVLGVTQGKNKKWLLKTGDPLIQVHYTPGIYAAGYTPGIYAAGYTPGIYAAGYTPGIYAAGYIVFALTFVRSYVRSLVRSFVRVFVRSLLSVTFVEFTSKFLVKVSLSEYISLTTHQKAFIFEPWVPERVSFYTMSFCPRVDALGWG